MVRVKCFLSPSLRIFPPTRDLSLDPPRFTGPGFLQQVSLLGNI